MRRRRYALPADEADIVRLALRTTLSEMEEAKHNDAYWNWYKARAENLLNKLEQYQWEVNE